MVVVGLATVVLVTIVVVDGGDVTCVVVMTEVVEEITSDDGLFVDFFDINVFPPARVEVELGMVVPDDKAALTKAMLLMIVINLIFIVLFYKFVM